MRKVSYIVGLTFIIIGFAVCLNYYGIIYGLPVYVIGTVLVILSNGKLVQKLLAILLPIVLWLPLSGLLLGLTNEATPETFLIPSNFYGQFRVVYGQKCGIMPLKENGRRILEIPQNGILIIQPKLEPNGINQEFYLVEPNGSKLLVAATNKKINKPKNYPNILFTGIVNIPETVSEGYSASKSPFAYEYIAFEVTNKDTVHAEHNITTERLDSLTSSLIEKCREVTR